MKTLVLGGTAEARLLGNALGENAVLSLAGVTQKPVQSPHRTGGFGGAKGLETFLKGNHFQAVIDATHPFAAQMSQNAFAATNALGLPLLRLERPPWPCEPEWQMVEDMAQAASAIPPEARVFLSVGSQALKPFLGRHDIWCLTRSIEPPAQLPPNGTAILQPPPFTQAGEMALMKTHRITHLVSKNAGGAATQAKLEAAAKLGVNVIMVNRPRLPAALTVETVAEAVKWVGKLGA